MQEFPSTHPEVKCKINRIYNSSLALSLLWDLSSENVRKLENSWSVSVRHMWNLPLSSHRYLIEPLSGIHARIMLYSRFINFVQSARRSPKSIVQFMLQKVIKDPRTLTGKNSKVILEATGEKDIFEIKTSAIKKTLKFKEIEEAEKYRVGFIEEITNIKKKTLGFEDDENQITVDELDEILFYLATS